MPRPLFTPRKNPVPIVQEAGWAPGPVWTGAENLSPTVIRSPDRPACSRFYTDYATRPTDKHTCKKTRIRNFASYTGICSRMKTNLMAFYRMNIEQFYRLSQLVGGEIQKQNTNYRRAIAPEERLSVF